VQKVDVQKNSDLSTSCWKAAIGCAHDFSFQRTPKANAQQSYGPILSTILVPVRTCNSQKMLGKLVALFPHHLSKPGQRTDARRCSRRSWLRQCKRYSTSL